ncbi:Carbon-nitrogen hydrolase [Rhodotorula mucilaginosa]|uniref:Carbon-nitrogen hydrolase n=1 Tax=Rhodotorula mucilaginosa TaxID=5537 RepID=A0A9P7B666_RHOMI|nr:Carbon-nitrogen hydrolase [Rhodotorula mucilaginosa]
MRAAVGQLCSTDNVKRNAEMCASIIRRAAAADCQLVLLPEAADFIADASKVKELSQPIDSSDFVKRVREQAKESKIWVGVCVHEATDSEKSYNSSLLITPEGEIVQNYHKLHLLDVNYGNDGPIRESKTTLKGEKLLEPYQTPVGKLGMLTCYDLRFPEGALSLRRKGAEIIAYPSAFTMQTGPPHWEVLLRARAIETQSYVLAAAQIGKHSPERETYGHAMIVDPWGSVIAQASTRPPDYPPNEEDIDAGTFVSAELDLDWLHQLRKEMPLWEQRRTDVYPEV